MSEGLRQSHQRDPDWLHRFVALPAPVIPHHTEGGAPAKVWRGASEAGLLVLLVVVGAVALDRFTETLPQVANVWPHAVVWLTGMAAAAVAAWLARRNAFARLAAVFLSLLTLLAAATLALYQFG